MRDYKRKLTELAMRVASEICSATEAKLKQYIEKSKPEQSGLLEHLLTDAERNAYLADEIEYKYGSHDSNDSKQRI